MPAKKSNTVFNSEDLMRFVERVETLQNELAEINADLREIWTECASAGYDTKYIRKVIKARKKDPDQLAEEFELTKLYFGGCGIQLTFDL